MQKIATPFLGSLSLLNGLAMLLDAPGWFVRVAASTGPFNPHFVYDVGAAFVVAGLALIVRGWRARLWPAAVAGAAFLGAHALIHLIGLLNHTDDFATSAGLTVHAGLALWAALPAPGECHV